VHRASTLNIAALSLAPFTPLLLDFGSGDGNNSGRGFGDGGGGGDNGGSSGSDHRPQPIAELAVNTEDDDDEYEEVTDDEAEEEDDDDIVNVAAAEDDDAETSDDEDEGDEEVDEDAPSTSRQQREFVPEADDEDDGAPGFYVDEVVLDNFPQNMPMNVSERMVRELLQTKPGKRSSQTQLKEDARQLQLLSLFDNTVVNVEKAAPGRRGKRVRFVFRDKVYPELKSVKLGVAKMQQNGQMVPGEDIPIMPAEALEGYLQSRKPGPMGIGAQQELQNYIAKWYVEHGYSGHVPGFITGLENGHATVYMLEPKVARVTIKYEDPSTGQPLKGRPWIDPAVIRKELPFKIGAPWTEHDVRAALRDVNSLGQVSASMIGHDFVGGDQSKIDVQVIVQPLPEKTVGMNAQWEYGPSRDTGKIRLASLVPGGTIEVMYNNVPLGSRQGGFASASVSTHNFLQPQGALDFTVDYKLPYVFGFEDAKKTALHAQIFSKKSASPIFSNGGSPEEQIEDVWVERGGAKIGLEERYNNNSKASLNLVLEQVTNTDEQGDLVGKGKKQTRVAVREGPPTALSSSGRDRLVFLQGYAVRDTTYYVNGAQLGDRDMLTVEQGLGVGSAPFFNRHTVSLTRFWRLFKKQFPLADSKLPPPVLAANIKYGGCVGSLPTYDAFLLGGPHSVRGFTLGELGAARRILEAGVELRVPVPVLNQHVYGFYEYGSDLGSSKDVTGNVTEWLRRPGSGQCYGVGVRAGPTRAEWVVDRNSGKGSLWCRFGDRW
jgi:hypothetical protein